MKISLEDIIRQEAIDLLSLKLKTGVSLQSAKSEVNSILTNVDVKSESSVSTFLNILEQHKGYYK